MRGREEGTRGRADEDDCTLFGLWAWAHDFPS
jgi:hypothetical protein